MIEPENPDALVAAIQQLNGNRDLGRSMGYQGRDYIVKNFSRTHTAHKYVKVLETIVTRS